MNLTVLTLIGMATLGQPGDDYYPSNSSTLELDIIYTPEEREKIKQTALYASKDKGQTWGIVDSAFPDKTSLKYTADSDGLYWLTMIVYFKNGDRQPNSPQETKPSDIQKVLIDTTPPTARIVAASRNGESIKIEWAIEDQYPDESATKVVYKLLGGEQYSDWQPIAGLVPGSRIAEFKTSHPGPVMVEVQVVDQAGNAVKLERELPALQKVEAVSDNAMSLSNPVEATTEVESSLPDILPTVPEHAMSEPSAIQLPSMLETTGATETSPMLAPPPLIDSGSKEEPKVESTQPMTLPPPRELPPTPGPRVSPNAIPTENSPIPPLGNVEQPWQSVAPPPMQSSGPRVIATAADDPPNASNAEYINFAQFDLQYAVDPGPSGISRIDLYVTRDDGRTWTKWSQHNGQESPLRVHLSTRFDPNPQGSYGLRMVPISGAGLSVGPPQPGTPPEMRVFVDTTKPTIKVYEPTPDKNNRNTLVLQWEANDASFGSDPILIEYSSQPTGPWQSVTAGEQLGSFTPPRDSSANRLPNTGSYPWPLPSTLTTASVYLKFTAWDKANNMSEVVTPRPVLVDLTRPQAKIQGILPGSNYPDSTPRITPVPGTITPPAYESGYQYPGGALPIPRRQEP